MLDSRLASRQAVFSRILTAACGPGPEWDKVIPDSLSGLIVRGAGASQTDPSCNRVGWTVTLETPMTNLRYADKVVIVTGGSSGIGKGCAQEFVRAGAKVIICCNDQDEGLDVATALSEIAKAQDAGAATFVYCDVRKTDDIRNLVDGTIAQYGKLDCLINNAGWHPPHKAIDDFSVDDFRDLLELNLVSIFTACKFALPYLRQTKGNIINMASLVATIGQQHATTYVATKGAITAFTKALAVDEAPNGVRVNSV